MHRQWEGLLHCHLIKKSSMYDKFVDCYDNYLKNHIEDNFLLINSIKTHTDSACLLKSENTPLL